MSIYYKNKNGQTNKIAGHLTQRVNARWFLLERSIEDGQEYYTVPEDQTQQYFSAMMPFTIYSFGFSETNTTATPKIKYKNEVYDIADVTALQPGQLGIGQLKGVYQMFTQESDTDKTIYFIGNMHQDFDNIQSVVGKAIQLEVEGVIDTDRVVFTVQDADSYLPYRTDLREFFVAAHLSVVAPTFQSLDPTLKVAIEFGDTIYNLYNYMFGADTPLTIGDLMSVATHDTETGFFFNFKATFFENSDITGFAVIPPAINATQIEHIIEDSETIVTDLTPDKTKLSIHLAAATLARLNRALVTPTSNPPATELVAVDTSGTQAMIKLGNEFTLENGILKANYSNTTFVDYSKAQALTEEQKAQARLNIGASSGSDVFDGQYENLSGKPILNTDNTITLPINANETIDGTISLHKVSKTGAAKDLNIDSQHNFITSTEKQQITTNAQNISDLDSDVAALTSDKFDKSGGTISGDIIVTGSTTVQDITASTMKLLAPVATAQQPYVIVSDDGGNTQKRAIDDLISDAGGSVVTVNGIRQATFEMNTKADASALNAEVTARTNAIANVQSQIDTYNESIVALTTAINTEAETRETEIENVKSSIGTGALTMQLNGITIDTFSANSSANKTVDVKALPNFNLNIGTTNGGNPRPTLFVTVDYNDFTSESGAYFKLSATSCHGNGSAYAFLEDIIIGVSYGGAISCNVYKFVQTDCGTYQGANRQYGDVFYVHNSTAKTVKFYILLGQYSSAQFTPGIRLGSSRAISTANGITQHTGTPTYYTSGDSVWATGNDTTYARLSDLDTEASTRENADSNLQSQIDTKADDDEVVKLTSRTRQYINSDITISGEFVTPNPIKSMNNLCLTFGNSVACLNVASQNTRQKGYIDFPFNDTRKLRHEYGIAFVNDNVNFASPYLSVLWANSSTQPTSDSHTERSTIKSISTTNLTFIGGATMMVRWEVWGIIET